MTNIEVTLNYPADGIEGARKRTKNGETDIIFIKKHDGGIDGGNMAVSLEEAEYIASKLFDLVAEILE